MGEMKDGGGGGGKFTEWDDPIESVPDFCVNVIF